MNWSPWQMVCVCLDCHKHRLSYTDCCPYCGFDQYKRVAARYRRTSPWWKFWVDEREWEYRE